MKDDAKIRREPLQVFAFEGFEILLPSIDHSDAPAFVLERGLWRAVSWSEGMGMFLRGAAEYQQTGAHVPRTTRVLGFVDWPGGRLVATKVPLVWRRGVRQLAPVIADGDKVTTLFACCKSERDAKGLYVFRRRWLPEVAAEELASGYWTATDSRISIDGHGDELELKIF